MLTCFFNELHSSRPASPEVYVDWQKDLGLDNIKDLLINQLDRARVSNVPTQVLVTGQKGSGKTTELHRVRERLVEQDVFVAFEDGRFVESFGGDITAGDILNFAAERLVIALTDHGIVTAGVAWKGFWQTLKEPLSKLGIDLKGPLGVGIGLSLANESTRRSELRRLFDAHRNRFIDMLNRDIIVPARDQLKEAGFVGITLLMDGLGDIPLRAIDDPLVTVSTNHEQIFLEQGDILAGLACDVVYTFPIELAYQGLKLGSQAGGEAQELGIIPVHTIDGDPDVNGTAALVAMLERRAAHCGATLGDLIADDELKRLCTVSGGHIRTLFELIQAAINRIGPNDNQVTGTAVRHAIVRRADTMQRGLLQVHRDALDQVRDTHRPPQDALRAQFTELLFSQHVLAFYDESGTWYDAHPLADPAVLRR